jgi:hypothetical protein
MPSRSHKRPRDTNQLAKSIVDLATGQTEEKPVDQGKRKGGLKGGRQRAKVLTPAQRAEIARAAASARWKKKS